MLPPESNDWLESFECLNGSLEADRSWFDAVLFCGLSHDRTDEIVGQDVCPKFLPDEFRCLASQDVHLQRLFQGPEIQLRIPARTIELCEVGNCELLCVQ